MREAHEHLIGRLAQQLTPVRKLAPPWRRAALWLVAVVWFLALLLPFVNVARVMHLLMGTPDMWLAALGQVLTAVLAALAAFETSVPGRSVRWAWLPVPAVALWVGASIAGMLRMAPAAGSVPEPAGHAMLCVYVVVLVGLPLLGLIGVLLRQACPLRAGVTAGLAGLAAAGAAATVLTMMHPFDANWRDLGMHLVAVGVILAGAWGLRAL